MHHMCEGNDEKISHKICRMCGYTTPTNMSLLSSSAASLCNCVRVSGVRACVCRFTSNRRAHYRYSMCEDYLRIDGDSHNKFRVLSDAPQNARVRCIARICITGQGGFCGSSGRRFIRICIFRAARAWVASVASSVASQPPQCVPHK